MKVFFLFFLSAFLCAKPLSAQQNNLCSNAVLFCPNPVVVYPAGVNAGMAQSGPNYGCLITQPNPAWYYLEIGSSGNIDIEFSANQDVDFICWGPYSSLSVICNSLQGAYIVDCSYSSSNTETLNIVNAVQGQLYMVMITNYSNVQQNISVAQIGGTGQLSCNYLSLTANPLCSGETTTINATTYNLSSPSYTLNPGATTNTNGAFPVSPAVATNYTVYCSGQNWQNQAVTVSSTINITPLANPTVVTNVPTPTICAGQTATVYANGAVSYTWSNGVVTSMPAIGVSPTITTTYTVEGVAGNGCKGYGQATVFVTTCTGFGGIEEPEMFFGPNPVSEELLIIAGENEIQRIEISDLRGVNYYSSEETTKEFKVDFAPFRKGIYFVKIVCSDRIYTRKVIRN